MAKNFLFTVTQLSADGSRVVQSNTILSEPRQDNSNIPKVKLKALAQHFYKLVEAENGSVVKDQYLVRKGKSLQVWVEQQHMLELEDFFESGSEIHSAQSEPVYVCTQQHSRRRKVQHRPAFRWRPISSKLREPTPTT